jgi:hypothetical protein
MKKDFIFLIFFILIISCISYANASLNLAPGKLIFDIEKGKQGCQIITLSSGDYSGMINIRDIWTNDINDSNTNKYPLNASDFEIEISYNKQLTNFNKNQDIQICITGNEIINKTRGAIIFTPISNTNVVVEVGAWIFVTVNEPKPSPTNNNGNANTNTGSGSSSSGSSGGGLGITSASINANAESNTSNEAKIGLNINSNNSTNKNEEETVQTRNINENESSSVITGSAIGNRLGNWKVIAVVLAVIIIAGIIIYNRNKSKQNYI